MKLVLQRVGRKNGSDSREELIRVLEDMGDEVSPELKERLLGISADDDSTR